MNGIGFNGIMGGRSTEYPFDTDPAPDPSYDAGHIRLVGGGSVRARWLVFAARVKYWDRPGGSGIFRVLGP